MKILKIKQLFLRSLLSTIVAFAIHSGSSKAAILLDFTEGTGIVTMTISGAWDTWGGAISTSGENSVDLETIPGSRITASIGTTTGLVSTVFSTGLTGLPTVPWDVDIIGSNGSGDTIGLVLLASGSIIRGAPVGYSAGDPLLATGEFVGTLADLGLPSSGAGMIDLLSIGGPENVHWSINGAPIPEPSSIMLLVFGVSLSAFLFRRNI